MDTSSPTQSTQAPKEAQIKHTDEKHGLPGVTIEDGGKQENSATFDEAATEPTGRTSVVAVGARVRLVPKSLELAV